MLTVCEKLAVRALRRSRPSQPLEPEAFANGSAAWGLRYSWQLTRRQFAEEFASAREHFNRAEFIAATEGHL